MPLDSTLAHVRALGRRRVERDAARQFLVEGPTLLAEALAAGIAIDQLVVAPGAPAGLVEQAAAAGAAVHEVRADALERAMPTVTPQPIVAVAPFCDVSLEDALGHDAVLVLVAVGDPGNAGTLVRSAEAAGMGAVLFCEGAVDPFNPKVVRASAGSLFHVPVVRGGDPVEVLERIGAGGHRRIATAPRRGTPHHDAELRGRIAFVLGSEPHGLPSVVDPLVDEWVSIPMAGRTDSLNVAMVGTLLCFEAMRQRSQIVAEAPSST